MIRLGDPTQNLTIPAGTNRTLRLANLRDEDKVRELIRKNIAGLTTILPGTPRGIRVFRMGQAMIPFAREADVMVEAKGKEHALVPLGIKLQATGNLPGVAKRYGGSEWLRSSTR